MALITCPECGGQVSDKADVCIHCGYPLKDNKSEENKNSEDNVYCDINGIKYDLSQVLEALMNNDYKKSDKILYDTVTNIDYRQYSNLSQMIYETRKIPKTYNKEVWKQYVDECYQEKQREKLRQKGIDPDAPAVCPKCGSTQFSTLQRGHSLIFGWLGSGEAQNVCQKCGYKWTPGRR